MGTLTGGGPWSHSKGKGYFKLSEWWTVFDQHYTDAGLIDPNITTGVFNSSLYGEYGITNRLSCILNAPLFSRNHINNLVSTTTNQVTMEGEAINSVGDIDLSLKYGLTKPSSNKIPLSVTLILGIPTGKKEGGTQKNLQTGDGEFNQMIQIDVGKGFSLGSKVSTYVSAYTAFNNRTNGYSEEIRYGIEAGAGLFRQKLWLVGRLNIVESLKNGNAVETSTSTSIFANNLEYTSIGVEANYYITEQIGLSASVAGALRGENIAAAPSYSVGVFFDLSN